MLAPSESAGIVPRPAQLSHFGPAPAQLEDNRPTLNSAGDGAVPGSHGSLFDSVASQGAGGDAASPGAEVDFHSRFERLEQLVQSISNELHSLREDLHEPKAYGAKRDIEIADLTARLDALEHNFLAEGYPEYDAPKETPATGALQPLPPVESFSMTTSCIIISIRLLLSLSNCTSALVTSNNAKLTSGAICS